MLEAYTGQPIAVGDWLSFNRGDLPNVLHRVEDVTETHVFMSGWNNKRSDGWFPKSAITHRAAGVLVSTR